MTKNRKILRSSSRKNGEEEIGGSDQGRPAQPSAAAQTDGAGSTLGHSSHCKVEKALCGSAVAILRRSWTSKKIKVPSSKESDDDLSQDVGLHDHQQLCTACHERRRPHLGLASPSRDARGVLGPGGGALIAL